MINFFNNASTIVPSEDVSTVNISFFLPLGKIVDELLFMKRSLFVCGLSFAYNGRGMYSIEWSKIFSTQESCDARAVRF